MISATIPQGDIDYLLVGHITRDLVSGGYRPGGTVTYASHISTALGCRTAVITSCAAEYEPRAYLPEVALKRIASPETTTFENRYTDDGRLQWIRGVAAPLTPEDVPKGWQRAAIVHLGPVANEIDPEMVSLFSNSMVGLTPQGWYRQWDAGGRIQPGNWDAAQQTLPLAAAVILSLEDLPDSAALDEVRAHARLVVLTEGAAGCTVFFDQQSRHLPAPSVNEVDPTGAGDIFAAAFLVRLKQTRGNPWEAADYANTVAAASVTQATIDEKVNAIQSALRVKGLVSV
ncbi:MAG: PfkB family carbohydrate kinase [Candidatus Promineifilaceae bacterium]|nr:PfkB family carbohydrate kinase [Candidatus Promineifilaceae bacterium]